MDSDLQRVLLLAVQALLSCLCGVLWFNFRDAKAKADSTARELADHKLHTAITYVTHSDLAKAIDSFNRSVDAIFAKLERIEDKLDNKMDKP
jgi:septal ring factor EnvC (AmiA/AmiB activator)